VVAVVSVVILTTLLRDHEARPKERWMAARHRSVEKPLAIHATSRPVARSVETEWRALPLLFGILALGATAGCASKSTETPDGTTCAITYTFSVPGHTAIQAASCAGVLSSTAPSLTVHR
jgi:hypothetical protein